MIEVEQGIADAISREGKRLGRRGRDIAGAILRDELSAWTADYWVYLRIAGSTWNRLVRSACATRPMMAASELADQIILRALAEEEKQDVRDANADTATATGTGIFRSDEAG